MLSTQTASPKTCPLWRFTRAETLIQKSDILSAGLAENSWAIVQAANFSTLFLLSREQNPPTEQIDVSLLHLFTSSLP